MRRLEGLLKDFSVLPDRSDSRTWVPEPKCGFSVRSCYRSLQANSQEELPADSVWRSIPPSKVTFTMWEACLIKLPTINSLKRRGRVLANRCEMCGVTEETCNHLFLHCKVTSELWAFVAYSFNISWCIPQSVEQLLFMWPKVKLPAKGRKLWRTIPHAVIWTIWKTRNDVIFKGETRQFDKIILFFKGLIFHWSRSLDWANRLCTTGLPSDVVVEVGEMSFHLHKFPLLSRSAVLEKLIEDFSGEDGPSCVLKLHDMPGGAKAFELVAKFCYGVKIELTSLNVVSLRCAAEHLQMNEAYGEGNLIKQTEDFLNEVFGNWADSINALEACEEVLPHAEEVHIVSRCINSLATKACADPGLFGWPISGRNSIHNLQGPVLWNGICTGPNPESLGEDWWYEDVSFLSLPLYKRFIVAVESRGMKPESIAGSIMFYAKKYLPGLSRHSSLKEHLNHVNPGTTISAPSEGDQRLLLEEIVGLLPNKKGVTLTKFLLRLLRSAMLLHASPSCRENLEKRVGEQLDQAKLVDLLIPNMGFTVETLYDVDCVQRILDHFMAVDQSAVLSSSPCIVEEGDMMDDEQPPLTPMTMVAQLVDGYLAEVAPDVNLKLSKFQSLAAVIPDYARALDDGLYRAIDIYLKAHPWLTDSEREQLCRLMNCQKLSLEACTHAAQNERLPLRVIVQVLFFEQLRLRTSIAGWFFVSDNLENSHVPNSNGNLALSRNNGDSHSNPANDQKEGQTVGINDMRLRVSELEKECLSLKQEIDKMGKTKSSWNILSKLGFKKSQPSNSKTSKPCNSNSSPPPPPPPP
ncbi:BTB/POZ-like [Macleaya cordata]|uniref:BTB/POZ-like n=1 Tax=Macleaya cordata TaxID=56857 RepID=A0A200R5Q8_MACCD|nr:BTB/POZ-like [Macleaya cordata]